MIRTFNYQHLKYFLAGKIGVSSNDPDFEDRYHDSLELWLRHWNGEGTPEGAICVYFQQWYAHKRRAKKHDLLVYQSALAEPDDEEHSELEQVFFHDLMQEQYCSELLDKLNKILKGESERTRYITVRMIQGDRGVDVADDLKITRQRVDQIYLRTLGKLINTV